MTTCCSDIYDEAFDQKLAEKELQDYERMGLKKNSKPFFDLIKELTLNDLHVMDIGGGTGALLFELGKRGIKQATHIDISSAYVNCFKKAAHVYLDHISYDSHKADFVTIYDQLEAADLVVLDKVICCYEKFIPLMEVSLTLTKRWYAFSVPRDVWWVKIGMQIENIWDRLKGQTFHPYIHSIEEMDRITVQAGFKKIKTRYFNEWAIFVYERVSEY